MDTKPWFIIFGFLGSVLLGMTLASPLVEVEPKRGQPLVIPTTTTVIPTTTTTTVIERVAPDNASFVSMWESISSREKEQLCLGWDIYGTEMYAFSLPNFINNRPTLHTFRAFFEGVCI